MKPAAMPDDNQPASKLDIAELRRELTASELRLAERIERAETALLTGFHSYAKSHATRTKALELRVAEIEERLLDIDQQLGKRQ